MTDDGRWRAVRLPDDGYAVVVNTADILPPATGRRPCQGYPEGSCSTVIPNDRIWCRFCLRTRQRAIVGAAGRSGLSAVGDVIEDAVDVRQSCRCGGDPSDPNHADSLSHRALVWRESSANRAVADSGEAIRRG
jgi:hypothetical protein